MEITDDGIPEMCRVSFNLSITDVSTVGVGILDASIEIFIQDDDRKILPNIASFI